MRILFEMDKKDYVPNGSVFSRPSARTKPKRTLNKSQ